jgi:hypothetical protein
MLGFWWGVSTNVCACGYRCIYRDRDGKINFLHGLKETLWHAVSHTLKIDVFRVYSFPARLVTVGYAFLVLIVSNTYTANFAAFLTADRLTTPIRTVGELRGKSVVSLEPYIQRLYDNHGLSATDREGELCRENSRGY